MTAAFPLLENGSVSRKKLTGKIVLEGNCPRCNDDLILNEQEILADKDSCPNCGLTFSVGSHHIDKAKYLRDEPIKAKEEQLRAKEQEARKAKEQAAEEERRRKAAADERFDKLDKKTKRKEKDKQKLAAKRLNKIPTEAKSEGARLSDEKFPNVPRALSMLETIAGWYLFFGALAVLLMLVGVSRVSDDYDLQGYGVFIATVSAALVWVTYVFTMATIEFYRMFVSIEDSTRKNNALLSMQIDLMSKLVNQQSDEDSAR